MKTNIRLNLFAILAAFFALWTITGTVTGQIYVVNTRDEYNNINGTVGKYNLDGTVINAALVTGLYRPQDVVLSGNTLFVSDINSGGATDGVVGKYDATTGAAISPSFLSGLNYPQMMALSGNALYVVSPNSSSAAFVALYDATTGATINPALVTGLSYPTGITIVGNDLYVSSQVGGVFGRVNKYNATTGAPISVPLVSGLTQTPEGLAVSGNTLWVANANTCPNAAFVGKYDAITGAAIDASFISGLAPCGGIKLVLLGNELYFAETRAGTVGVYDATTGAALNSSLISGLTNPFGFIIAQPPPHQYTTDVQSPINASGSSVFNAKRGVVPVKFTLFDFDSPVCELPPATIAVTRTAGGTTGEVNESLYSMSADIGSSFRIDNCQYIYNLNSGSLGVGSYRVDIRIDGQIVGSAVFQLK